MKAKIETAVASAPPLRRKLFVENGLLTASLKVKRKLVGDAAVVADGRMMAGDARAAYGNGGQGGRVAHPTG